MGFIKIENLSKAFGAETLFSGVSFEVRRGEKVGLIGGNGAGKTTLFRCLLGLEAVDGGQIITPLGETIGYVEQTTTIAEGTLWQELASAFCDVLGWHDDMRELEQAIANESNANRQQELLRQYGVVVERFERAGGYEYENRIRKVAFGLGFSDEDFVRPVSDFSGGQKTRISLARALIRQPDFLFLDEPTNHLDIGMVEWLEDFLTGFTGGAIIISHDRYFLDRVAGRILEMEDGQLIAYKGNYSQYLEQKAERMAAQASAYEKQQAMIDKTQAFIDRYRAGVKAKQARGREKRLARMERIILPAEEARFNFFAFNPPGECAERVVDLDDVTAAYGSRIVFSHLMLNIRRGDGVALVGPNGAGKTTLLKLLTGDLEPASGKVRIGNRVKIGYFSQEHENLNSRNSLLDELRIDFGLSEERSRHYLGAFLFCNDDVFKKVADLSGGEKARLAMLKLMLTGANFLVLDEPTNHLDIPAKEAVEEAIMAFPGTFLTVSHDRYFLDKVANCVIELEDGRLAEYGGNYSYYREKKPTIKAACVEVKPKPDSKKNTPRPQRRLQDIAKAVKKLESEIAELEGKIADLEFQLNNPDNHTDPELSRSLAKEHADYQSELDNKYSEWLEYQQEE